MARRPRISVPGIPQHVIQRGNNRQVCFGKDDDLKAYASWLTEYSQKCEVEIHAWVFMTNHIHLLCTPTHSDSISKLMQSMGRMYVRYYNKTYQRSGTLWEVNRPGKIGGCLV